ncbi:MAG: hypothetical protein ACKVOM_03245 [Ferruginibacter sp.]
MKTFYLFFSAAAFCFSCTQSVRENTVIDEDVKTNSNSDATTGSLIGCYQMVIDGDTAFMELDQTSDSLYGTLLYKRKTGSLDDGAINLKTTAGRAEGFYSFKAEGKIAVRQMVFKIKENALAEGYGDVKMQNDTAVLKYPHAINFEEKHSFNKVNCK